MEFCKVWFEAHTHSATIYVMGFLADPAAAQTGAVIELLPLTTRTVRMDLRAVDLIDPAAFVSLARALNRWRDQYRGRVTIEFPARSQRSASRLHLVRQSPVPTGIFDQRAAPSAAC